MVCTDNYTFQVPVIFINQDPATGQNVPSYGLTLYGAKPSAKKIIIPGHFCILYKTIVKLILMWSYKSNVILRAILIYNLPIMGFPFKMVLQSSYLLTWIPAPGKTVFNWNRAQIPVRLQAQHIDLTNMMTSLHSVIPGKNKSSVKRQNTLGCLDQYTCIGLRLWNSQDCETV